MSIEQEGNTSHTAPREGVTGWEVADAAASGVGKVFSGIGWLMLKGYALALIAFGIFGFSAGLPWVGLLFGGYGLYLLLPGGKFIIY